ncbi:MAG: hypothetical protein ABII00_08200, partial [Elusimicrobiota bacterium]
PDVDGDGVPNASDACPAEDASGSDANADGCIDSLDDAAAVIEELDLLSGIENELISKIEGALAAYDKGNDKAAENKLNALKNSIDAQSGKKISAEDADMLYKFIDNVIR